MSRGPDLSSFSTGVLKVVVRNLERRTATEAVSRTEVSSWGLDEAAEELWQEIQGVLPPALSSVVRAVLNERRVSRSPAPQLVWTGPSTTKTPRDTSIVVRELLEDAKHHILLSIYSWTKGEHLLAVLRQLMEEREIEVELYLHVNQKTGNRNQPMPMSSDEIGREIETFIDVWGDGEPVPKIYYDRRLTDGTFHASLHAKCVVVDGETSFVGSANFTERGHQRNIEVGVILRDKPFAQRLLGEFRAGPFDRFEL